MIATRQLNCPSMASSLVYVLLVVVLFLICAPGVSALSEQCENDIMVLSAPEAKATMFQALDAWGKPVGVFQGTFTSLGDMFQCRSVQEFQNVSFSFVLLNGLLIIKNEDQVIKLPSQLGTCLPSACSQDVADVTELMDIVVSLIKGALEPKDNAFLGGIADNLRSSFTTAAASAAAANHLEESESEDKFLYQVIKAWPHKEYSWDPKAVVMIVIWTVIALLVLTATALDYLKKTKKAKLEDSLEDMQSAASSATEGQDNHVLNVKEEASPLLYETLNEGKQRLLAAQESKTSILGHFSLYETIKDLCDVKVKRHAELSILNVFRVVSIWWVVFGHTMSNRIEWTVIDLKETIEILKKSSIMVFANAHLSVETFFFLSCFLCAYLMLSSEKSIKHFNYFKYLAFRYIRLMPLTLLVMFSYWAFYKYTMNGPTSANKLEPLEDNCAKYWWTQLILINNFHPVLMQNECMPWGWYLAADFQLYMIAPLFILPLAYKKWRNFAFVWIALAYVGFAVQTIVVSYLKDVPALASPRSLDLFWNVRQELDTFLVTFYDKPYNHIVTLIVATVSAYLCVEHKKSINSKDLPRRMGRLQVLAVQLFGAALLLITFYVPFDFIGKITWWPRIGNAFWNHFSRLMWSVGLACLIYPTVVNPKQTVLLSGLANWKGWLILTKLTFPVYLAHCVVINVVWGNTQRETPFTWIILVHDLGGVLFWSYLYGAILYLTVEAPINALSKRFLR
jgi:peptidoglycan/LPS O-acetylase OafA/YrhL